MKPFFIVVFLTCAGLVANAQETLNGLQYIQLPDTNVEFHRDTVLYTSSDESREYPYSIEKRNELTFLKIVDKSVILEYLVLYNPYMMYLYKIEKNQVDDIWVKYPAIINQMGSIGKDEALSVTSELVEGTILYSVDNLRSIDLETPWVEGNPESGIGEKIIIKNAKTDALIFLSGYISFKKPWLYTHNARPKKISVKCEELHLDTVFDLQDTPNPQILDMGTLIINQDIVITILDIYPGEKYKNLCINTILLRVATNPLFWE